MTSWASPGGVVLMACMGLHCHRPATVASHATDAEHAALDAGAGEAATQVDAAKVIASIQYGRTTASGDIDLICTHDGAARSTYFNPGFSSQGAEVVPGQKTLAPSRVDELWSAAEALVRAMPAQGAIDASSPETSSIAIHFSDGGELQVRWAGVHPDPRVQRLVTLLTQGL